MSIVNYSNLFNKCVCVGGGVVVVITKQNDTLQNKELGLVSCLQSHREVILLVSWYSNHEIIVLFISSMLIVEIGIHMGVSRVSSRLWTLRPVIL